MEDIIEIGEDGTFEIPTTQAAKPAESVHVEKAKFLIEKEQVQPSVLDIIGAGEFKVFRNQSTSTIYVLVCLQDNEAMKTVSVSQNAVRIELEDNKELVIALPSPVNASTAKSTVFKKYLTIEVSCI